MFGEGPPGKFLSLSVARSGTVALMCTAFNMQTKHAHNWLRLPLACLTFECRKSNKFIQEKLIKDIKNLNFGTFLKGSGGWEEQTQGRRNRFVAINLVSGDLQELCLHAMLTAPDRKTLKNGIRDACSTGDIFYG